MAIVLHSHGFRCLSVRRNTWRCPRAMKTLLRTTEICESSFLIGSFRRSVISNHGLVGKCLPDRIPLSLSKSNSKALSTQLAPQALMSPSWASLCNKQRNSSFDLFDLDSIRSLEDHRVRDSAEEAEASKKTDLYEQWGTPWREKLGEKARKTRKAQSNEGAVDISQARDPRMWPYAGSMVMVGLAAGVVMPSLPLLAVELGVTQVQFGYITSAFGLAKLISNAPSGVYAERYGRQTTLVAGCLTFGAGYLSLAFATSLEHMILARFIMGGGAAFTMAGATMAIADISTESNRARMMGTIITAFSAGAVVGPVIGSGLIDSVGFQGCSLIVSGMLLANALGSRALTSETMQKVTATNHNRSMIDTVRKTFSQWTPLCRDERLRNLLVVNAAYRVAVAGGMFTILPLMLTQQFVCGPSEIGMVFAMQSMVSVLSGEPCTQLADHFGPHRFLAPAMATMAFSFAALPMATDIWCAMPLLMAMALSNTVLLTAPTAAMANLATVSDRAQSLSLLRTAGDAGFLLGGVLVGTAAGFLGVDLGLQGTSALLMAAAVWFATRGVKI